MDANNTATVMMIQTSDRGLVETRTHSLISTDPRAIVAHAKKAGMTAGFSLLTAVNRETGRVVVLMKDGYFAQRDLAPWLAQGFNEWVYSWAFSGDHYNLPGFGIVKAEKASKIARATMQRWARAFGQ